MSHPPRPTPRPLEVSERAAVWVVDDSALQAEVMRRELLAQCDVRVFTGGAAVLEHLAAHAAPELLVVDWHMPDVSGADVCRFVRRTFNSAQLPIAILTATGTNLDLLEALAAGANDFIQKPVAAPELTARVGGLVRLSKLHSRLSDAEGKLRLEAVFRERFIGMLAHDLRQPLATFLMGCETLAHETSPDRIAAVVERQRRAAERMQRMVTDLLDSTRHRPESGVPIDKRKVDLADVARLSLEELRAAYRGRDLRLNVEGSGSGYWDADRLAQILSNLVGNALAHGDPDCSVDVRLTGNDHAVELRVSNRGQPIPEVILATLEHPFHRSRSEVRSREGLGLGLHIVHHIVRAHGGTLASESRDGVTHVIVSLPRDEETGASEGGPVSGWR